MRPFQALTLECKSMPHFFFFNTIFSFINFKVICHIAILFAADIISLVKVLIDTSIFFSCQDRSTTMILFSYTFIIYMMLKLDNVSIASNLLHQFLKYFYQYYKALSSERSRFTFFIFVNKYIGNGYINCSY